MRSWGFEGRLEEEQVRKLLRQLALYPLPRTLVVAASSRKEVLPPRDLGGGPLGTESVRTRLLSSCSSGAVPHTPHRADDVH